MTGSDGSFALPRPGWRAIIAGGLAVVVIGVLIVARMRDGGHGSSGLPAAQASSSAGSSASAAPSTSSPAVHEDEVGADAQKPSAQHVPAPALEVAGAFVAAWAHHPDGVTPAAWWGAVSRYTDAVLREQLQSTDPQRVPATKVTGPAHGLAGGVSSATIAVPTDAGEVVLTCVLVAGRWLVSDLDLDRGAP